jgi:hypothetical protein
MNDDVQPKLPDWIEPSEEDKKCRPHCVSKEEARELLRQYEAGLISKESFESKSGWRFWNFAGKAEKMDNAAQQMTMDEFLERLRQMKNEPDDAPPSPGTRIVAKHRPCMNKLSREQREELLAEAMKRIYGDGDAARRRAWNELCDKVEKAGLYNADYTGECE